MKFKKDSDPNVVEAVRYQGYREWSEAPIWLVKATQKPLTTVGAITVYAELQRCSLFTADGPRDISKDDYIVRSENGDLEAVPKHSFELHYKKAP